MFGSDATRLARIDWSKYGRMELSGTVEPTNEQLKRAVEGLSVGIQQLAEEIANMAGNVDIPAHHRAPFISINYTPNAPGVDPDSEELESFFPQVGAVAGDSWNDPTSGLTNGGQAFFGRGVWILQPAINNPNVLANNGRHRIVLKGGLGAGICFENAYIDNLYYRDGTPYSFAADLPAGSMMMWTKPVAEIPSGWAIMDGTANAAPDGSGIDMRGFIPQQYISGDPDFGTIGGTITPDLTWSGNPLGGDDTTVSTSLDGGHVHEISGSTLEGSITVATHDPQACAVTDPGHTHEMFTAGISEGAVSSPYLGLTSSTTDFAATGITVDSPSLTHGVSATTIDTATNGAHTHDVTINDTLAGKFTVNTPNLVRPAGKVVAFIEKLEV